ncbi:hypothetical protein JKF63_03166 [Porcisia hertigi]|uniref:Uncharacterized protein n=1 Tax=Porcisia hertigi TaxID=2761500 RepID=A0A836L6G5_9TRYP|nr:hypothetical protein JKF63_03166 [Porcisia hertigi]
MALQENKDSYEAQAFSLAEFVLRCSDCRGVCLQKTARILENGSRAPQGWESVYNSVAEERRLEDLDICESRCRYMQSICPSENKVRQYEEALATASPTTKKRALPDPTILQEASRCQHAVELFSNILFALAHKPSKISFGVSDPRKAVTKFDESQDGAPTEAHRKVLEGAKNIDQEIMRRWTRSRQTPVNMKEEDISTSAGFSPTPDTMPTSSGSSGTSPRW